MKLMAIDCEMNQPSGSVIQIGAISFNPADGEIGKSLRIYVNTGETLSQEIVTLTGITQEQVDAGISPMEAYLKLKDFALAQDVFRNPVVWGAGASNDALAISRQAGVKDEDSFMGHRVIDVKTLCVIRSIMMKASVSGGLQNYLDRIGAGWDSLFGKPHDALADAFNTQRAFVLYSQFVKPLTYLERFHAQSKKVSAAKGKWQGVISRIDDDIAVQIAELATLQQIKNSLKKDN